MYNLRLSPSGPFRAVGLPQFAAGAVPDADAELAGERHTCQVYELDGSTLTAPRAYAIGGANPDEGDQVWLQVNGPLAFPITVDGEVLAAGGATGQRQVLMFRRGASAWESFAGALRAPTPSRDLSVNQAQATVFPDRTLVLRTGAGTNPAGGFNGTAQGNKAVLGVWGFDRMPIGDLEPIELVWTNLLGPTGPFNTAPSAGDYSTTPYILLLVDFSGAGDLRVCFALQDDLDPAIVAAVGTYTNNGANVLTYRWDNTLAVTIADVPADPSPGGVLPAVTVGPSWFQNAYAWADLVAANPDAVLVDAFPANPLYFATGDAGLPAGAWVPAINILSGSAGTVTRSGKRISSATVNGRSLF